MTRDLTSDAANPDKSAPVIADKLPIIDTETTPDSLKEITLANLMKFIDGLTADTSPDVADEIVTYDASAAAARKVTLSNFWKVINALTADSAPDRAADYVATYDASAGAGKKVFLNNLGVMVLSADASNTSPLNATTYYFGAWGSLTLSTSNNVRRLYIQRAGKITKIDVYIATTGTLGSSETSTMSFRLNDTTDTTISSAITTSSAANHFTNTALGITVAAGDYFEIKWVTPTWATPPTGVYVTVKVYIE